MKVISQQLDYSSVPSAHFKFFTANCFLKANGALVMGAGAAKCVRDLYPAFDKEIGRIIRMGKDKDYLLALSKTYRIGAVQVKRHYTGPASLELIRRSFFKLRDFALLRPSNIVHCNYPGVGNGGLRLEDVESLLSKIDLPDNVWLYL